MLSLSLVGHAWQSYVTWLIVAFVPLVDPRVWGAVPRREGYVLGALAVAGYASIAIYDVALYRVIGNTSPAATVFASLPNVMLPVLAFVLVALRGAWAARSGETRPQGVRDAQSVTSAVALSVEEPAQDVVNGRQDVGQDALQEGAQVDSVKQAGEGAEEVAQQSPGHRYGVDVQRDS